MLPAHQATKISCAMHAFRSIEASSIETRTSNRRCDARETTMMVNDLVVIWAVVFFGGAIALYGHRQGW